MSFPMSLWIDMMANMNTGPELINWYDTIKFRQNVHNKYNFFHDFNLCSTLIVIVISGISYDLYQVIGSQFC